jgi:hypothetical protein
MRPKLTMTAASIAHHLQNIKMAAEAQITQGTVEPVNRRQMLLHLSGQEIMTFMEPADAFDKCMVGAAQVGDETVVVYDKLAVIASLAESRAISAEEAYTSFTQSFSANAANRLTDDAGKVLPQMPIFMTDLRDIR